MSEKRRGDFFDSHCSHNGNSPPSERKQISTRRHTHLRSDGNSSGI